MEYFVLIYTLLLVVDVYTLSIASIARIICDFNYYHRDGSLNHKEYLPYMMSPGSGTKMMIRQLLLITSIVAIAVYLNLFVALILFLVYIFYRFALFWLLYKFKFVSFNKYVIKKLIINQQKWIDFYSNEDNRLFNLNHSTSLGMPPFSTEISNDILKGVKNFKENAYK